MSTQLAKPTGSCWCGCGTSTESFFAPGHDRKAESMLMKLLFGRDDAVVAFLDEHGYGDGQGRKNLLRAFEAAKLDK